MENGAKTNQVREYWEDIFVRATMVFFSDSEGNAAMLTFGLRISEPELQRKSAHRQNPRGLIFYLIKIMLLVTNIPCLVPYISFVAFEQVGLGGTR